MKLKFQIQISEPTNLLLLELGNRLARLNASYEVIEKEEIIFINLTGSTVSVNFVSSVEKFKREILEQVTHLTINYNVNLITEFSKSMSMEDVFYERKKVSLLKENKEEYFISGNPNHFLTKNNSLTSLFFRIGKLCYREAQFNTGVLAKFLIEFSEKHNIPFSSEKRYYDISEEEIYAIIDFLEERNKNSLLYGFFIKGINYEALCI